MRVYPTITELLRSAHVVSIPTLTTFRGIRVREAVLFDAPAGASEFSPFLEYDDREAAPWLRAAMEFGWEAVPDIRRDWIPVNATVPAIAAQQVPQILARFPGCTTIKVKVAERGQRLEDDIERVRIVREIAGDSAKIRLDANGGWSVAQAEAALHTLARYGLDYAEQPCMSVPELTELRTRLRASSGPAQHLRIAADESVRKAADPLAVARAGAADLLIVKAQPLGGIIDAVRLVEQAGLPVVVSSALDTSVGIAMGTHLAASLPTQLLDGACGLGTVALLDGDVTRFSLLPEVGGLPVVRPPLDHDKLRHYEASRERIGWWRERIQRCYELLITEQV